MKDLEGRIIAQMEGYLSAHLAEKTPFNEGRVIGIESALLIVAAQKSEEKRFLRTLHERLERRKADLEATSEGVKCDFEFYRMEAQISEVNGVLAILAGEAPGGGEGA